MENKQTAVAWLEDQITKHTWYDEEGFGHVSVSILDIEQAKAMDKEQKRNMFDCGRQYQLTGEGTFTEVYNETYGCQTN